MKLANKLRNIAAGFEKLQVARANETFNSNLDKLKLICEVILETEAKLGGYAVNTSYFFSSFWVICKEKGIIIPENPFFRKHFKQRVLNYLDSEAFFVDNSLIVWDNGYR